MKRNLSLISWVMLLLAAAAWTCVALLGGMIGSLESQRAADAQEAQHQTIEDSQAAFTHAFVTNSVAQRSQLEALLHVDPSQFARYITGVGTSAGVPISITSATQGPSIAVDASSTLSSYVFLASGHGSFAALARAAKLLEAIPAASSLQQIVFNRDSSASGGGAPADQWVMNAQIQFYTESSS